MMGVIDETKTLKENQIFAQYSEQVGLIKSPTKILKGIFVIDYTTIINTFEGS